MTRPLMLVAIVVSLAAACAPAGDSSAPAASPAATTAGAATGLGKALLSHLAALAVERDCARLEYWVLDWNEPAINFYKSLGAKTMDDWTTFRIDGAALDSLANSV